MCRVFVCNGHVVNAYPFEKNAHWGSGHCAVAVIGPHPSTRSLFAGAFTLHEVLRESLGCTLALRGLECLLEPLRGSAGSAARYWAVHSFADKRALLLLQYLPRHSVTSVHWHAEERELFFPIRGSCMVTEGVPPPSRAEAASKTASLTLAPDVADARLRQRWVDAGVVHQLKTDSEPALNLILVTNTNARTLKELNHHHVRWET